jgi:2,3-bisphosphoglycerate-independent phosphoglycerate mutase
MKKTILIILDRWGIGNKSKSNVIHNANTPNIDRFTSCYPNSTLCCCGEDVGLPEGQMGNSEVGHLTIGAGRIVYQDLVRINKAIADMVGHTGVYSAIKKAVETVDACVGRVVETALGNGYTAMIIADHGNADYAGNDDGSQNTVHSLNPVPCIIISEDVKELKDGVLADVAPTLLKIMGIPVPTEMTGKILV